MSIGVKSELHQPNVSLRSGCSQFVSRSKSLIALIWNLKASPICPSPCSLQRFQVAIYGLERGTMKTSLVCLHSSSSIDYKNTKSTWIVLRAGVPSWWSNRTHRAPVVHDNHTHHRYSKSMANSSLCGISHKLYRANHLAHYMILMCRRASPA